MECLACGSNVSANHLIAKQRIYFKGEIAHGHKLNARTWWQEFDKLYLFICMYAVALFTADAYPLFWDWIYQGHIAIWSIRTVCNYLQLTNLFASIWFRDMALRNTAVGNRFKHMNFPKIIVRFLDEKASFSFGNLKSRNGSDYLVASIFSRPYHYEGIEFYVDVHQLLLGC